ncbi:MAG: hypothetical protein R3A44_09900 [Caldilineaceae bacterium]
MRALFGGNCCKPLAKEADPDEITVLDAGFHLPEIHLAELERYVVRMAANCTARQNRLPEYKGRGARPKYGA